MSKRPPAFSPRSLLAPVALAATFLLSWSLAERAEVVASRPTRFNVVLVSIDTLRADRLSLYGYPRATSPFLDHLASEAIVFDGFYYTGGGTLPSHLSMLTSLYPANHGIGPRTPRRLEEERVTLAEVLHGAGFATAAFVGGGWLSARFGFDQGFDQFDESGHGFAENLPKGLAWIRRNPNRSFFLFLHTYDVHSAGRGLPYDCPGQNELRFAGPPPGGFDGCRDGACASRWLGAVNDRIRSGASTLEQELSSDELRFVSDLYDGCVHYADDQLRELVAGLKALDLLDRTLLVITSDHGEEFGEHGFLLHDQGGYEELAHLPLIVRLPGGREGGRRVEGLAAMVDLAPTILDLVGLDAPAEAQGESLVPAIRGLRTAREDVHMYSVLRTAGHKYFSDERFLFDLANDGAEKRNVWSDEPELVAGLERRVRSLIAVDHAAAARFHELVETGAEPELPPEIVEKLRSLGYLR